MPPRRSRASWLHVAILSVSLAGNARAATEIFWYDTATPRVQRCDVASCAPVDFAAPLSGAPQGDVAIDPLEGMVYWAVPGSNPGTAKIQRKSLAGGAVEDMLDMSSVSSSIVTGLVVDPVARLVYVATPGASTRIRRFPIDDPTSPEVFVAFNDAGCSCSPQGLALDLAGGFLYWPDQNNGKIARKALDLSLPIQDVVTGLSTPRGIALDLANDRVYFGQVAPNRISYALLSSPTTIADLVNPLPDAVYAGCLDRDPSAGTLGELYVALTADQEIRHCDLDAGCASLALLTDGMQDNRGLALLVSSSAPGLGPRGRVWTWVLVVLAGTGLLARRARRPAPSGVAAPPRG